MRIYLAGPLFSTAEREFNARLAERLRKKGHQVWLPQEKEQRSKPAKEIFDTDLEGIETAEAVVANMDGADPDSGTCWECGYAFGKKPVILFRTDFRGGEPGKAPFNLMLTESADKRVYLPAEDEETTTDSIANAIDQALKELPVTRKT